MLAAWSLTESRRFSSTEKGTNMKLSQANKALAGAFVALAAVILQGLLTGAMDEAALSVAVSAVVTGIVTGGAVFAVANNPPERS